MTRARSGDLPGGYYGSAPDAQPSSYGSTTRGYPSPVYYPQPYSPSPPSPTVYPSGQYNPAYPGGPGTNYGGYWAGGGAGLMPPTVSGGPYTQTNYNPNALYGNPTYYYGNNPAGPGYDPAYASWLDARFGSPNMEGNIQSGIDYARAQELQMRNATNAAYAPAAGGGYQSGQVYTPGEIDQMTRAAQYQSGVTTPEQFAQWQLTPEEQAAYQGNPYAGSNYFSGISDTIHGNLMNTAAGTYGALEGQDVAVNAVPSGYKSEAGTVLGAGTGAIRGAAYDPRQYQRAGYGQDVQAALASGAGAARATWENPELAASSDYMSQMNFGPSDINDLETQAGGAARARYVDQLNQAEQAARAEGVTSPMGIAALKGRYLSSAAADAADAQTGARIQGRGLQLQTLQNRENTRLGAAQHQADLAAQGELTLGGRELQALSDTEAMRLGAAGAAAGRQIGAEQGIMGAGLDVAGNAANLGMQGAQYLGSSRLAAIRGLGQDQQQALQYMGTTGAGLLQQAEAAASQRAGNLATYRSSIQQAADAARFSQNQSTQDRLAAAAKAAADQRLAYEQERRNYYGGTAGQYYQGGLTGQGQYTGAYEARTGATTGASGAYGNYALGQQQVNINRQNMPTAVERGIAAGLGIFKALKP